MQVPDGLVTEPDLRVALDEVIDHHSRWLPPDPISDALSQRRDDVAGWAFGQISGEWSPSPEEIIAVSKGRHGIRPVAVWDIPTRLLYSGIVAQLAHSLPNEPRSAEAWNSFLRSPLEGKSEYIVSADIAACYDTIDHGLLAEELRLQTGDHRRVACLIQLLQEVGRKRYGLPQQTPASDVLAGAFLARMERALHRRGLRAWRYNDDFRIACDSWSDVIRSLETLDEEARRHGLLLNDSKTITWRRDNYQGRLNDAGSLMASIAEQAEIDLRWYQAGAYGDPEDEEPDPDEVIVLASARLLELWLEVAGSGVIPPERRDDYVAIMQLMPTALTLLEVDLADLPETLKTVMLMLRYEQTLTPWVSRFIAAQGDDAALMEALDRFLGESPYLTGWQTWWLQYAYSGVAGLEEGPGGRTRVQWLRDAFIRADRNPILRAHAALSLARRGAIPTDTLLQLYDRSTPTVRPTVAAALAIRRPTPDVETAIRVDSRVHDWVFDHISLAGG